MSATSIPLVVTILKVFYIAGHVDPHLTFLIKNSSVFSFVHRIYLVVFPFSFDPLLSVFLP